jgi:hypothetical protein
MLAPYLSKVEILRVDQTSTRDRTRARIIFHVHCVLCSVGWYLYEIVKHRKKIIIKKIYNQLLTT